VKREKKGFTLVELLTVLAIVALLVSLLIPSLTMIRNAAKEAKQKSQLTEIGLALTAFLQSLRLGMLLLDILP